MMMECSSDESIESHMRVFDVMAGSLSLDFAVSVRTPSVHPSVGGKANSWIRDDREE